MQRECTVWLVAACLMVAGSALGFTPGLGPVQTIDAIDDDLHNPQVVYNSVRDEYLVVWHTGYDVTIYQQIMGARVDRQGNVIAELTIAAGPYDLANPTVAFDPVRDRYLVAFEFWGTGGPDIWGRMVPGDGPSGSYPVFVINDATTGAPQRNPAAAYSTLGSFKVAWQRDAHASADGQIRMVNITPAGAMPSPSIVLAQGSAIRSDPDIAINSARNQTLVVYEVDSTDISGVRLDVSDVVIGAGEFGIAGWPGAEYEAKVEYGEGLDEWMVVWTGFSAASQNDVWTRRVSVGAGGDLEFGAPFMLPATTTNESGSEIAFHPAFDEYLVVWEIEYSAVGGPRGIRAQTITHQGLTGSPTIPVKQVMAPLSRGSFLPSAAASTTDWFVAWEQENDETPVYTEIWGRAVIGPFFFDGFEAGNTNEWDDVVP